MLGKITGKIFSWGKKQNEGVSGWQWHELRSEEGLGLGH